MITIQELHTYYRLSQLGLVPSLPCPITELDGDMVPWVDENDNACFWCLACDAKSYLGIDQIEMIKSLLHR